MSRHSCIYEGVVRHRRTAPIEHRFQYRLFLLYLDLDELPTLFREHWLWSAARPNIAWFRRSDHLGPADQPLAESVRDLVMHRLGHRPCGAIRLLTHLRYFGCAMNPISLYYCFNRAEQLDFVVAEVTNTPWGEQHCYVLDFRNQGCRTFTAKADKELHVSPFLDMHYAYEFRLTQPGETLSVHIENYERPTSGCRPALDATLALRRRPLNGWELARVLVQYPMMTFQVLAGIYWQAFRLWWKGAPFFSHPAITATKHGHSSRAASTNGSLGVTHCVSRHELKKVSQ